MSDTQLPENNSLVEDFILLQGLLHRHFEKKRREQGPFGNPHRGQGRVLSILKLQPVITQKELSYLLDMRPQSLGELLSKLENNGYLTREPSENDRRVMIVKLTKAGEAAANQTAEGEKNQTVFDTLSENDQLTLSEIIHKLITELEKEIPAAGRGNFPDDRGLVFPDSRSRFFPDRRGPGFPDRNGDGLGRPSPSDFHGNPHRDPHDFFNDQEHGDGQPKQPEPK